METPVRAYNGGIRSVRQVIRTRVYESMFRRGPKGLEPLAPPGEGGAHIHYVTSKRSGIGCITSRRAGSLTDEEFLALKHGLTVAEVRRLLAGDEYGR